MFLAANTQIETEMVSPMLKNKIKIKKKKKRIPVPKKPPKIEKDKRAYDRKSEKKKVIKKIVEETSSNA
jgi:hypothetical protein